MGRSPCCSDEGVKKGPWTSDEDEKLTEYIKHHGHGSWRELPRLAGLNRCGKSCRLRWTNYLRPDIKRGKFDEDEEEKIIQLHAEMGNKWSAMASRLPGRTDNEIKNHWNTHLRKKLMKKGIDPVTHKPRPEFTLMAALTAGLQGGNGANPATTSPFQIQTELAQWARVQLAESLIQVLVAAAPGFNGPVAASVAQHSSMGNTLAANQPQLPQLQGGSCTTGSLDIVSSGTPAAAAAPLAAAAASFSLSSLSGMPCFPQKAATPNMINHTVTSTSQTPMQQQLLQPGFCPTSGALPPQKPMDVLSWSYATGSVQATAGSTHLRAPQMDALDALMAELDIPSASTSTTGSAASDPAVTPSGKDDFSNYDILNSIILEDMSSWSPTGFVLEKLQN